MSWKVKSSDGEVQLTAAQVVRLLSEKVAKNQKPDVDHLVTELSEFLESSRALGQLKLVDLLHLGWMMGYYYRVFLDKNRVELPDASTYVLDSTSDAPHAASSGA